MRGMSGEHWVLLASFLGVVGMQLAAMGDSWEHAFTPSFIGGLIGQTAILVRAMFTNRPSRSDPDAVRPDRPFDD